MLHYQATSRSWLYVFLWKPILGALTFGRGATPLFNRLRGRTNLDERFESQVLPLFPRQSHEVTENATTMI